MRPWGCTEAVLNEDPFLGHNLGLAPAVVDYCHEVAFVVAMGRSLCRCLLLADRIGCCYTALADVQSSGSQVRRKASRECD